MANGDWSFPRDGCSCTRFKTQITKRPWIGCQLWPSSIGNTNTGNVPNRYFLNVLQEWSSTPIFAARNFSASWDITKENFGEISSSGGNPQPPNYPGYFYPYRSSATNITAGADLFPFIRDRGTGNYSFKRDFITDTNYVLHLELFSPGSSTSIVLNETFLIAWGPLIGFPPFRENAPASLRRTWSNEFTPAMMDARLREDLELELPHNAAAIDVPYPNNLVDNSVIPNIGENRKPWARGGMLEFPDYGSAVGLFSREGIVNDTTVDYETSNYGHAHSWQSRTRSQGFLRGSYGDHPYQGSLSRCKIYQPGRHSIISKSLLDGSPTSFCQSFLVECPDASQSELLLIEPPEKDLEKKQIYFNRSDCTFPSFV